MKDYCCKCYRTTATGLRRAWRWDGRYLVNAGLACEDCCASIATASKGGK